MAWVLMAFDSPIREAAHDIMAELGIHAKLTRLTTTGRITGRVNTQIDAEEYTFDVIKDYKYLGTIITQDKKISLEIVGELR